MASTGAAIRVSKQSLMTQKATSFPGKADLALTHMAVRLVKPDASIFSSKIGVKMTALKAVHNKMTMRISS